MVRTGGLAHAEARVQFAMADYAIRPATLDDLEALTDIYNHYVVNTAITFDLHRSPRPSGNHGSTITVTPGRIVCSSPLTKARCVGYASSSRWRPKPAYNTTVEASVYCHPDAVGRGCGTALYTALFAALDLEDVQTIVAGVSLPNPESLSFHERFGFQPVGVFHAVGRKFNNFWDVAWFERRLRLSGDEAR
jgi:phosphinothricin acetyltransferase